MSGDPDQEYFADGISEDLITGLSRIRWLFVIARNSTFVYKQRAVDVKQVSRELGVRYVLYGSVRRAGNMLRISAQLIDAVTGGHHWAERYDRELGDIFAVQDEITRSVAAAIEPHLLAAEGIRALSRSSADLGAWELGAGGARANACLAPDAPGLYGRNRRPPTGRRDPFGLRACAQPAGILPGVRRAHGLD
jgi:TolB-like protein